MIIVFSILQTGFARTADQSTKAAQLLTSGSFEKAAKAYSKIIVDSNSDDGHVGLVYALIMQDDESKLPTVLSCLKELKLKYPDNPGVQAAAGYACFCIGRTCPDTNKRIDLMEASQNLCIKAIQKNHTMVQPYFTIALASADLGDMENSFEYLRLAYSFAKINSRLMSKRGMAQTCDRPESEQHYACAIKSLTRKDYFSTEKEFKELLRSLGVAEIYYPHLQKDILDSF